MQESVANLKAFVEKEAKTLHQKPEEILLSIICQLSSSLIEKLDFLVQNNEEVGIHGKHILNILYHFFKFLYKCDIAFVGLIQCFLFTFVFLIFL